MMNSPWLASRMEQGRSPTARDQIQMALAIADTTLLTALLTHCFPPITQPALIGGITSEVGIPVKDQPSADGIVQYEAIRYVLAESRPHLDVPLAANWTRDSKELARLTQHESEMRTLAQNLPLAPAIALLHKAGFQQDQIQDILRLPHYAWHKSWWYGVDAERQGTFPFLRCLRTFHYPDGTLTLQYKDFFDQEKPNCFTSLPQKVLIAIRDPQQGFAETLQQVNRQREALGIAAAVLVCATASELEIQAFTRQSISLYPATETILPIQANCERCDRADCPLNHQADSPVIMCRNFLLNGEFV